MVGAAFLRIGLEGFGGGEGVPAYAESVSQDYFLDDVGYYPGGGERDVGFPGGDGDGEDFFGNLEGGDAVGCFHGAGELVVAVFEEDGAAD